MNVEKIALAMIKSLQDDGHYVDAEFGPQDVCVDAWIDFVKLANVAIEAMKGQSDEIFRLDTEEKKGNPA